MVRVYGLTEGHVLVKYDSTFMQRYREHTPHYRNIIETAHANNDDIHKLLQ